MDLGAWLKQTGLERYEAAFRDNRIDEAVLPHLTAEDLKEIGVATVGDRRKLLAAIAALASPTASAESAAPRPFAKSVPEISAERRPITIMFCDLVGSTALASRLDAEDWRSLVNAYLDEAAAAVAELGGYALKRLGDGLMALFGYPTAQENDAERAVRAALAIQRALGQLNRKNAGSGHPELVARIGVETGPVVVDSAGDIFGDAPNIAARVQALAEPGTVLVTAKVQRQVAGLFVAEDRGQHTLKGAPEPITLYQIVRASGAGRRSGQRALTPFVGREDYLATLLRGWERAKNGLGQFVMIVGEPGIGKSRLIEEFHARLRETPHTWVEWSSSQLLQNTALHPIADWGRQRFGGADVFAERRLAELETALAQVKLDPAEYAPLLAPLVDVPLPPERAPALAPEELRRRQMAALNAWMTAGARTQPIVLAVEDLQWADPTTLDVMRSFAERGALTRLLVVATARPDFRAPWGARTHHGTITLAPLDRAQVRQMVRALAERHALASDVIDRLGERTGGVPLFIEEVTRLLLERGEQGGAQAIPPTLAQSLTARLDRLGSAREVAMIGAVLGRDFSYPLLRAVAGLDEAPLHEALERLAKADILLVEGLPPDAEYRFKHALIQDAAYENLLKSRRQALHRRAAETLRDQFPDRAEAEPEVLAHHFTQAGHTDAAIEYWGKAGDQALRRSAFQEAIAHLGKAIEMADKEGGGARETPAGGADGQRLRLQTSYSNAVMWSRGYGSGEATAAFARAQELATGVDNAAERFEAYFGQYASSLFRGELRSARETAETFLREAEKKGGRVEAAAARRSLGVACHIQGDLAVARAHFEQALSMFDPERDREAKFRLGIDGGVSAASYLACTIWQLGEAGLARRLMEEAVANAVQSAHAPTLANAYFTEAGFHAVRNDAEATRRAAESGLEVSRAHGLSAYLVMGVLYSTWASARLGDHVTGAMELRKALAAYAEQGNKLHGQFFQGRLAELEADGQDAEGPLARIGGALALAEQTGQVWSDALLHRIRGDILLKAEPEHPARAEEAYRAAIAVARVQGARSFGLQAALKLAKLYQSTGRPIEAHDILAPALEGFSQASEMPEIAEAQALLKHLA